MTGGHNPSEERLLAYAAGTLSPPEAVVVAAHLAIRPQNDAWVRALQAVGGWLLDDLEPEPMPGDALARVLARAGFLVRVERGDPQGRGGEVRTRPAAGTLRPAGTLITLEVPR
jgi:anti-sigma factor ChrR (cupin superfamily)